MTRLPIVKLGADDVGRSIPTELQQLLDLPNCESHSTVDIYPVVGSPIHVATINHLDYSIGGISRTSDLRRLAELKQSIMQQIDRIKIEIQNVDQAIGITVAAESLVKAEAVVGRLYRDPLETVATYWIELFRGQVIASDVNEATVEIEVLNDLTAAGFCIASDSLAENCQWVYKQADTCGYAGSEPTCNKRRRSPDGCQGRMVTLTESNEFRFGGMEFPEPQAPAPPSGGGGEGGGEGGGGWGNGGGGWTGGGGWYPPIV